MQFSVDPTSYQNLHVICSNGEGKHLSPSDFSTYHRFFLSLLCSSADFKSFLFFPFLFLLQHRGICEDLASLCPLPGGDPDGRSDAPSAVITAVSSPSRGHTKEAL